MSNSSVKHLSLVVHDTGDEMWMRIEGTFEPAEYRRLAQHLTKEALNRRLSDFESLLSARGIRIEVGDPGREPLRYHATTVPAIYVVGDFPTGPFTTWSSSPWLARFQMATRLEGRTVRVGTNTVSAPFFDIPTYMDRYPETREPKGDRPLDNGNTYEFNFYQPVPSEADFAQKVSLPENSYQKVHIKCFATEAEAMATATGLFGEDKASRALRMALEYDRVPPDYIDEQGMEDLAEDHSHETGETWQARDVADIPLPVFFNLLEAFNENYWEKYEKSMRISPERVMQKGIDIEQVLVRA